jgi:oligoendopeptidase F
MTSPSQTWSLSAYFPAFDGPEYRAFKSGLAEELDVQLGLAADRPALAAENASAWAASFNAWEGLAARLWHLASYLGCLGSADAANEAYQSETSRLAALEAKCAKLKIEILRALRSVGEEEWAVFLTLRELRGAEYRLEKFRREAGHQMTRAEEALAADLGVDGFHAWSRLYDTITGKMSFAMDWPDGRTEQVPMAQCRALIANASPAVRRAAFAGGNRVWEGAGDTLAAALNSIAGTRLTLYGRRGQASFLEAPFDNNGVSRDTVDAMFAVVAENRELPRRILRAGARLQGKAALAWWDLEAPRVPGDASSIGWDEAVDMVGRAVGALYPAFHEYILRAVSQGWIESEKRSNKRPGGYCTGSALIREERVYMTFNGTMNDVSTLAHEMGHAWHSHLLGGLRPCAQDYPMTLAETASTFAEQLLAQGLLADPSLPAGRRLFFLDQATSHVPTLLLNIPARFEFERRFYEERRAGPVAVSRLCELMVATQREVYGDVLAPGREDPWFWASKLHFYFTDASFYNFPYTFGFLLSQALFGEFLRTGRDFLPLYEKFLSLTGSASCEEVVRRSLGKDIRDREFWRQSLAGIEVRVRQFETATSDPGAPCA